MPLATLTPLPPVPTQAAPADFHNRGNALMAALPPMVQQASTWWAGVEAALRVAVAASPAATAAGSSAAAAAASAAAAQSTGLTALGPFAPARPSLLLDFSAGQALDARVSFTRSSAATRINALGLVETVAANRPRFEHAADGACRGLLIEEQCTNTLLNSEAFDQASWIKTRVTVTADAATSPDGTADADKLVEDTATGVHYVYVAGVSFTAGTTYTLSVYAKAADRNSVHMNLPAAAFGGSNVYADFNLSAGTFSSGSATNYACTDAGGGWWRCSITATASATTSANTVVAALENYTSYTGNGASGIFVWGAQLEAGPFASSYIPTTGAAATRAVDAASIGGAAFAAWYRAAEWTVLAEYSLNASGAATGPAQNPYVWGINNSGTGGFDGYGLAERLATTNRPQVLGRSGATQPAVSVAFGAYAAAGQVCRAASAMSCTELAVTADGKTVATTANTVFGLETQNQLLLGTGDTGGNAPYALNGCLRRLAYYPVRLANAELQALTTP